MTFEVDIQGRTRVVVVERIADFQDRYRVTLDGTMQIVDAVLAESDTLSLIFPEKGGTSHEVGFARATTPGELVVHVQALALTVTVNGRRQRRGGGLATSTGDVRIVAPMPGRVVRVLATPGDDVAARQPLLVVEAMKMENEFSSPRPGRVKEVVVAVGQSVEAGRLLVVVE